VELRQFQLNNFSNTEALRAYIYNLEQFFQKHFLDFRIVGYGSYEAFEGLRHMTDSEIMDNEKLSLNSPEYLLYLRLKEKFEPDLQK
jgi:hypothetical protein